MSKNYGKKDAEVVGICIGMLYLYLYRHFKNVLMSNIDLGLYIIYIVVVHVVVDITYRLPFSLSQILTLPQISHLSASFPHLSSNPVNLSHHSTNILPILPLHLMLALLCKNLGYKPQSIYLSFSTSFSFRPWLSKFHIFIYRRRHRHRYKDHSLSHNHTLAALEHCRNPHGYGCHP